MKEGFKLSRPERALLLCQCGLNPAEKIRNFLKSYYPKWFNYLNYWGFGTQYERSPITLRDFR